MSTNLKECAENFEKAIEDCDNIPDVFLNAIKCMKNLPEKCEQIKCWRDTVWEIVADFLNYSDHTNLKQDYFYCACALLEKGGAE